jgi:hypothetical protein
MTTSPNLFSIYRSLFSIPPSPYGHSSHYDLSARLSYSSSYFSSSSFNNDTNHPKLAHPFHFLNRTDAGKHLAAHPNIQKYSQSDLLAAEGATTKFKAAQESTNPAEPSPYTIVLALPRGGVPVAYPIAESLKCPLDLLIVRKLGLPYYEEVAMGAISIGDVVYLNKGFIKQSRVSQSDLTKVMDKEVSSWFVWLAAIWDEGTCGGILLTRENLVCSFSERGTSPSKRQVQSG